ncbi:helix-turn-helix domain-containing protein [Bradyrhizobium oligotrophicum]|uniref:helix-turn-helix domain-containing protein n=1 Tax=Bradyrhizobium oligotrophicum TaxID=44255 RepID=UPI003EB83742
MSKKPPKKEQDEATQRAAVRPTPESVGAKIRAAREARNWTQARLAAEVGTTQQTIEKIEAGKVKRTSYLHDILSALNLPPERHVFVKQLPVFHRFVTITGGAHFRIRRETRGLDVAELASLSGVTPAAVEALEQAEGVTEPSSPHHGTAVSVDRYLRQLERRDPAGEPSSEPGDFISALPSGELDFPYFRMGETKGIFFEFFAPSPWDIPRVRGYFGLKVASWIQGSHNFKPIRAGARFYARPFRDPPNESIAVIAHRSNVPPAEIEEVYIGQMIRMDAENATLQLVETSPPLVLSLEDWSFSMIQFAALTDFWSQLRGLPPNT